jgi:hypothetical protein
MPGTPIKRARREKAEQIMSSQDFWEQLWEHMAEGNTLRSFVGDGSAGITYGGLIRKIQSDPELHEKYEIVRNARALANAERIEQLAQKVEDEQIDPNAAKVSIGARQWLAERMDAKRWGNKIQQDVKITDTTQLHLEAVRNLMRTVANVEPKTLTVDTATGIAAGAHGTTDRAE